MKKKAAAVLAEASREVARWLHIVINDQRKTGYVDLEAVEMLTRSTMHRAGAAAITEFLQFSAPAADQRLIPCPCGQQAHYCELRSRALLTVVGETETSRPYFLCPHCHNGQFPADVELDIEHTECSPGVRRMKAVVGYDASFDQSRRLLKDLAELDVTAKSVERTAEGIGTDIAAKDHQRIAKAIQLDLPIVIGKPVPKLYIEMDGTGISVVKEETEGRKGRNAGQPAHTREAKLGSVFTQTGCDKEGYAIRDPDSTTYVGAIETAEEFGKRLYLEAWDRGYSRAVMKIVIGDGAEWIWNLADQHFPSAIKIVDLFHAREHLWELARKLHPNNEAEQKRWMEFHQDLLDNGKMKKLTVALNDIAANHPEVAEKFRTEAEYFRRNAMRMRYPRFRRLHLFVGSGVIEAGCKTVIGKRLKQSGMFWTVKGANAIIALRCCQINGRFEDYWERRRVA
jgi:hypothetical protein